MPVRVVAEENEYQEPAPAAPAQAPQMSPAEIAEARGQLAFLLEGLDLGRPAAPEPAPAPKVVTRRVMPDREILAAMNGLGAVLVVRLMLLLAVIGAYALAWQAMRSTATGAIWILGVYAMTIVAPLVWLSTKRT